MGRGVERWWLSSVRSVSRLPSGGREESKGPIRQWEVLAITVPKSVFWGLPNYPGPSYSIYCWQLPLLHQSCH